EGAQCRHIFWGGSGSNLSRKPASDEHKSECFGEITGRRVVVGTAVAAEPRSRGVDVPGFHPLPANLICVLCEIDGVSEFVSDIEGKSSHIVLGTHVDFDPPIARLRHRANTWSWTEKDNLVLQLLPGKMDHCQRCLLAR